MSASIPAARIALRSLVHHRDLAEVDIAVVFLAHVLQQALADVAVLHLGGFAALFREFEGDDRERDVFALLAGEDERVAVPIPAAHLAAGRTGVAEALGLRFTEDLRDAGQHRLFIGLHGPGEALRVGGALAFEVALALSAAALEVALVGIDRGKHRRVAGLVGVERDRVGTRAEEPVGVAGVGAPTRAVAGLGFAAEREGVGDLLRLSHFERGSREKRMAGHLAELGEFFGKLSRLGIEAGAVFPGQQAGRDFEQLAIVLPPQQVTVVAQALEAGLDHPAIPVLEGPPFADGGVEIEAKGQGEQGEAGFHGTEGIGFPAEFNPRSATGERSCPGDFIPFGNEGQREGRRAGARYFPIRMPQRGKMRKPRASPWVSSEMDRVP